MTDPAVEAARNALAKVGFGRSGHVQRVAAAREALKPIRELHAEWARHASYGVSYPLRDILQRLAPLIFTTEELER